MIVWQWRWQQHWRQLQQIYFFSESNHQQHNNNNHSGSGSSSQVVAVVAIKQQILSGQGKDYANVEKDSGTIDGIHNSSDNNHSSLLPQGSTMSGKSGQGLPVTTA
jgi:hypothetical protein